MAKYVGYKRPKDTKKTLKQLFVYLGHYKWMLILVAFLVFISAGANVPVTLAPALMNTRNATNISISCIHKCRS